MPSKASLLSLFRKVHLYFGLFISPSILFFAFTGAVQTLGYHEASSNYQPSALLESLGQIHKKQTYLLPVRRSPTGPAGEGGPSGMTGEVRNTASQPRQFPDGVSGRTSTSVVSPAPEGIAAQAGTLASSPAPPNQVPGQQKGRPGGPPQTLQAKQKQHLPLKIFFVLVSLGLFASTFTGIYMAYKYDRNRMLVTLLLLSGALLPILLVPF